MKMFSDCSGPCETCKTFHLPGGCIAGHGDDGYVYADAEWVRDLEIKHANARYADDLKRERQQAEV